MKLMTVVLGEWGLTTESAELENGKSIYAWSGCWELEPTSREDNSAPMRQYLKGNEHVG